MVALSVVSLPRSHTASFGVGAPERPWRLPPKQQSYLRAVFTDDESGLRSTWSEQLEGWAGGGVRDRYALWDAEAHCDEHLNKDPQSRPACIRRAREALILLAEGADEDDDDKADPLLAITILRRMYGAPRPGDRYAVFDELAPLAELTAAVQARAIERELLRRESARGQFVRYWELEVLERAARQDERTAVLLLDPRSRGTTRTTARELGALGYMRLWDALLAEREAESSLEGRERRRYLQLEHVVADVPLDLGAALREGLDAKVAPCALETRSAKRTRLAAHRAKRALFVNAIKLEAEAMLTSASRAFQKKWKALA